MKLYNSMDEEIERLPEWQRDAIQKFSRKMTDKKYRFPCIPATQAHGLQQLRYGFVGCVTNSNTAVQLAKLLKIFTEQAKGFGKYTTLIVFFETPKTVKQSHSIHDFENAFWNQLNKLSQQDERNWPSHIPIYPEHNGWEFCFHGEQYFMYCATPSHKLRQSRSFPYFMMAITPRWVLKKFFSNEAYSSKIKQKIRERLIDYDHIPPHAELKQYGEEDNYEWKQYFLHDEETALTRCPFHHEKTQQK